MERKIHSWDQVVTDYSPAIGATATQSQLNKTLKKHEKSC